MRLWHRVFLAGPRALGFRCGSAAPAPGGQAQLVQGLFPCLVRELDERPVTTCGVVDAGAARERGGQASFSLRRYYILYLANPAACVKERSYPGTRSK